jgi:sarcosine oxidase subunit delta
VFTPTWNHQHGCPRWFNALRDTMSDAFIETYVMGARPSHRPSDGKGA